MPSDFHAPNDFFKAFVYEQIARVSKALSSPQRLILMNILMQGEHSVEVLAHEAKLSIANTSRHLQVLKTANLVTASQRGNQRIYRIASELCGRFFESLLDVAHERSAELRAALEDIAESPTREASVGRDELLAMARAREVVIVDVRPACEYEAGHLESAISIPLAELEARLDELPAGAEIVAYCRGRYCLLADRAVEVLQQAGFNVRRTDETVRSCR